MVRRTRATIGACAAWTLALLLGGCSVDPDANPHHGCGDCPQGFCVGGYCLFSEDAVGDGGFVALPDGAVVVVLPDGNVIEPPDAGPPDGGEVDAGGPQPCSEEGKEDFCYDGPKAPKDTSTLGLCRAGKHTCERATADADLFFGPCLGQVLPLPAELCNGEDDDCDGEKDEEIPPASCDTGQKGVCMAGVPTCQTGMEVCERSNDPGPEVCNGDDDDCDGMTDEGMAVACYPAGLTGCQERDGAWICDGLCAPGMRDCADGVLKPCSGHTPPVTEDCASSGTAADEDCDGKADESCPCTGSEQQACSSGGNPGVGECLAGTQTCDGSTFGPCEGEVLPTEETCANEGQDDDCNGTEDDIPTRGDSCTDDGAMGVCRDGTIDCLSGSLGCDTPAPADMEACDGLDDDCDGMTDEAFQLATDEQNCGMCGNVCPLTRTCCAGRCVDTKTDEANCQTCGTACGSGLTCCDSDCVDTDTDESNCGMCGKQCGGLPPCCVDGECNSVLCL